MSHVPEWVKSSVFYQIFPDRFAYKPDNQRVGGKFESWHKKPSPHGYKGGNLLGIIDKLDYLQDLGINAIYLTPIFQSASNHRYHTHDYYKIDPVLGTMDHFRELIKQAHRKNMKVILDGVFNHASRGFFYFNDVLENGEASPWKDWFYINRYPLNPYGNGECGYDCWWGIPALPKLNHDNPEVREYIMKVGEYWIEQGIDGWRLDDPREIKVDGFWEEFRSRIKKINPEAYLLGEVWQDAGPWLKGDRFDGLMNYELFELFVQFIASENADKRYLHQNHKELQPIDAAQFSEKLRSLMDSYSWDHTLSQYNLIGSHDVARFYTLINEDKKLYLLANLLLFCLPGVPSIYCGDEVGLKGGVDPDCRRGFPLEEDWDIEILNSIKSFIALRVNNPVLQYGKIANITSLGKHGFAFSREHEGECITCVFNPSKESEIVFMPKSSYESMDKLLESSASIEILENGNIMIPSRSYLIYKS